MMTDGKHEGNPPDEEDAALWSLLERAKPPGSVSPYFARRVLREVAAQEDAAPAAGARGRGWLARWWQPWQGQARGVFAGAVAAVALLAVGVKVSPSPQGAPVIPAHAAVAANPTAPVDTVEPAGTAATTWADNDVATPAATSTDAPVAPQDVEVIADLDNLLSREESRLWTDEDTSARN